VVVRGTRVGGKEKNLSSVLKVPRFCPFVLSVRVKHLTGIVEVKFHGLGGGGGCV
jgi:hypothetical protein